MLKRGHGDGRGMADGGRVHRRAGNPNVILCERGIRTFETYTRNTLDLSRSARQAPDPPADHRRPEPRHREALPGEAAGDGRVAVGADGLIVEVHPNPEAALSDAEQQLTFEEFASLMEAIVPIHEHVRALHGDPLGAGAALGVGGELAKH